MTNLSFNQSPEQLDESALGAARQFEHIPIYCPQSKGGRGDIYATVKLARGIRREFPDKKVFIYFEDEADCVKADSFLSDKEREKYGLELEVKSEKKIRYEMEMAVVGMTSVVNCDFKGNLDDLLTHAAVNFYLTEYDTHMILPAGMRYNQVYTDHTGRKHLVLRTGLDPDSLGIHIDPNLVDLEKKTKPELIEELRYGSQLASLPEIFNQPWTIVYNPTYGTWDSLTEDPQPLQLLYEALLEIKDTNRKLVVFDFTPFGDNSDKPTGEYSFVRNIFLGNPLQIQGAESGRVWDADCRRVDREPLNNVTVVNIGSQSPSIFLDFLRASEEVVGITGDVSLAEAVSLDKLWTYNSHRGKVGLLPNFIRLAHKLLDEKDADRISQLVGDKRIVPCTSRRIAPDEYGGLEELKKFYLDHRTDLLGSQEKWQTQEVARQHLGSERQDWLAHYDYALRRAITRRNLDGELAELEHVHRFSLSSTQRGFDFHGFSRLFYDTGLQESFHRMNQAVIEQMDLSKNLAALMREAVDGYQKEGHLLSSWSKVRSERYGDSGFIGY